MDVFEACKVCMFVGGKDCVCEADDVLEIAQESSASSQKHTDVYHDY